MPPNRVLRVIYVVMHPCLGWDDVIVRGFG